MLQPDSTALDRAEDTHDALEAASEVAYAEVGGVERAVTNGIVTHSGVESATGFETWGVWWRLFADGGSDYRYIEEPTSTEIDSALERSIRAATVLDQSYAPTFDSMSIHRAVDPGWARPGSPVSSREPRSKLSEIGDIVTEIAGDRSFERIHVEYQDEDIDQVLLTTTGSILQTSLERASVNASMTTSSGFTGRRHFGRTTGEGFLEEAATVLESLADRTTKAADESNTPCPLGNNQVLLSPLATGQLIHEFTHYLEIDTKYLGASPIDVGDVVGPDALDISDEVRSGSWGSFAYDAEGTPTRPVTLVDSGEVTNCLHSTASAINSDTHPHGSMIQSIGLEHPARVHARHLDVSPGTDDSNDLLAQADLYVERFGEAIIGNEATRVKRSSRMPPSVDYARTIADRTPADFTEEADEQRIEFPLEWAYIIEDDVLASRVDPARMTFTLEDLLTTSDITQARDTLTGVCKKHRSRLPFAVTAPAISLSCEIHQTT